MTKHSLEPADESYLDSKPLFAALSIFAITALSSATISPVLLGLYVDAMGLSLRAAGLVSSAEAAGLVLAQLLFIARAYRWNRRTLALASAGIAISSNLVTLLTNAPLSLSMARLVAGVGAGFAISILNATFAARSNPQRAYASSGIIALVYAAALLSISGWITGRSGLTGLILVVVGLNATGACACAWIPPTIPSNRMEGSVSATRREHPPSLGALLSRPPLLRLTATVLILYAGHNALWAYQERMGASAGLHHTTVGFLLGISVVGGVVGMLVAALLGTRAGLLLPLLASYAILIAAAATLALTPKAVAFVLAVVLLKTAWFYGLPYLQGGLARLDGSGRAVVLGGVFQTLGATVGVASAAIIAPYGYAQIGVLSAALYALCIPLSAGVLATIDRTSRIRRVIQC